MLLTAVLFGGIFGGLLASGWVFRVEEAIAEVSAGLMTSLGPADIHREVDVKPHGGQLEYHYVVVEGDERHGAATLHTLHTQNLALFAALVLASPGLALRTRAIALVVGLLAIFLVDVVFVMGDLWRVEFRFLEDVRARTVSTPALYMARYVARLHPTGSLFFALPFLWAFVLLGPLGARPDGDPTGARPRRGKPQRRRPAS